MDQVRQHRVIEPSNRYLQPFQAPQISLQMLFAPAQTGTGASTPQRLPTHLQAHGYKQGKMSGNEMNKY